MSRCVKTIPAAILLGASLLAGTTSAHARQPGPEVAPPVPPAAPVFVSERQAQETRQQLRAVMRQHPPSVGQVLQLDHSLLSRPDYLASYPTLAAFLAQHPEVVRNPEYYLGEYVEARQPSVAGEVRAIMWGFSIVAIVATVFGVLAWIIRQIIDYRRWLRASAAQKDVQAKLMDRLTDSRELLAYLESPAGKRLIEGSYAVLDGPAPQRVGAPVNRILWSVQVGVVLAVVGVPLWFLHHGLEDEVRLAVTGAGVIVTALGIGFILSALIAWTLSVRLGLMRGVQSQQ